MTFAELSQELVGSPKRVHLIGVAGSGMSGIAGLLLALGHRVSGSDKVGTLEVERLRKKGLEFEVGHHAQHAAEAEIVIYSSAIKAGNPTLDEARRLGRPLFRRADALAAIMHSRKGIVVSGMHGKTTTSAMAAHVLRFCGLKPSHYVGAEIPILGVNARWDSEGEYFVAEGDESDGTLINYSPEYAIVLNIEPEHLDFYRDLAAIDAVYGRLANQTKGKVIYCADDPGASRVCAHHPRAVSYGIDGAATYRAEELASCGFRTEFAVTKDGSRLGRAELGIPGRHNVLNAVAVVALALELGLPFESIAQALSSFRGAKRRFEVRYEDEDFVVVDDYGHHPSEIAATLGTARSVCRNRVVTVFQPHRYSRTQLLRDEFGPAFRDSDAVLVADVYPAGEAPIPGISGLTVADAVREHGNANVLFQPRLDRMPWDLGGLLNPGDLVLTLGAGNVHEVAGVLSGDLALRRRLIRAVGPGTVRLYESMARHTTLRVGGPAQYWVEPETVDGFCELVRFCFDEGIPFMVLGRGSNLLVLDGGLPGVVAYLARGEFAACKADGAEIHAGAGVRLKALCGTARSARIGGFEWMEGIPGSVGGALRMNAGAMGVQTFEQVLHVRVADRDGNLSLRRPADLDVRYRNVPSLSQNFVVSALLQGVPSDESTIDERLREFSLRREASQPVAASAGCIFKNPSAIPAGKLVEELGFKNFCVGRARVSEVHGNFFVNDGGATAEEMLTLIEEVRAAAEREAGVALETEVQIVGVSA